MLKSGHYGAALLLYAPVGFVLLSTDPVAALLAGVGVLALARVPDYDLHVPWISHRGPTHTLLFALLFATALAGTAFVVTDHLGLEPYPAVHLTAAVGAISAGSHLLADALTPYGVPLLWPLSDRRFSLDLAVSTNPIANYGLLVVGVGLTAAVAYLAGLE